MSKLSLLVYIFVSSICVCGQDRVSESVSDEQADWVKKFEITGDPVHLYNFLKAKRERRSHIPDTRQEKSKLFEAPQPETMVALRALEALNQHGVRLQKEKREVKVRIDRFLLEMRKRTDQPFITFGVTAPEAIPDENYRKIYREFISDRKFGTQLADRTASYLELERSFSSIALGGLRRVLLLKRIETISAILDKKSVPPGTIQDVQEELQSLRKKDSIQVR